MYVILVIFTQLQFISILLVNSYATCITKVVLFFMTKLYVYVFDLWPRGK